MTLIPKWVAIRSIIRFKSDGNCDFASIISVAVKVIPPKNTMTNQHHGSRCKCNSKSLVAAEIENCFGTTTLPSHPQAFMWNISAWL